MHPLQRRSLFAILSIAESAIQQMKSILAQEDPDAPAPVRKPQSSQPGTPEYLSENEEEEFERLFEADRQRMRTEDEKRVSELWGSDE